MKAIIVIFLSIISLSIQERLIFEDNFNSLNFTQWQHEITMGGGGNWEFQMYVNNRTNSFTKNGTLYIKPTLSIDTLGEESFRHGIVNVWGGAPADLCTSNAFYGCERNALASGNVINPIQSARLRTVNSFAFKYGRVEVRAKLPKGDWIWPAIWLLPKHNEYGNWPASGEIDIMESRGNSNGYPSGSDSFGSTLHWGPYWNMNGYKKTHKEYKNGQSLGDEFHVYGLYWSKERLYTYIDDPSNVVLDVPMTEDFWTKGEFPDTMYNPWKDEGIDAPFNKEFYLILNVAVGGTNSYFPDGVGGKPWTNDAKDSVNQFWNAKAQWYSTWKDDDVAMKIDYVKVWELDAENKETLTFLK